MRELLKKITVRRGAITSGFTLVELLIVIALIGILSVAVLATINPIEQSNKARDAKFKNDAAEVLSAFERFYASQNVYPWQSTGVGDTAPLNVSVAIGSTDAQFGVGGTGVGENGVLIITSELKESFKGKAPFNTPSQEDVMYVYNNGGDVNYVCFVPKASASRTGSNATNLKCLDVGTGINGGAVLYDLGENGGTCVAVDWGEASDLVPSGTQANLLCVPEGDIPDQT